MAKLTDAQLIVLSKAAQREDRAVELPSQLTARFAKALEALIERGLLEDVPSERAMPVWRHAEETNEPRGLIITELGLVAIGVIAGGAPGAGEAADDGTPAVATELAPATQPKNADPARIPAAVKPGRKTPCPSAPVAAKEMHAEAPAARAAKSVKPQAASKLASDPAPGGKTAAVIKLLERKDGASIAALIEATGWLPHSTRAALTGLRKKGYAIERGKARDKTTTVYRIAKAPAGKAA